MSGNMPAIADTWRSGYIPIQDFGSEAEGTTIRTRHMRHGVRIVGRRNDDDELGMGHYIVGVYDNGTIMYGDIIGGLLWQNEAVTVQGDRSSSLRETAAIAYAWPSIIHERKKGKTKARPIFDEKLEEDDRFMPVEVATCVPIGPGRKGIVLDAVKEDEQIELFFPADGINICHWRGKDPNELSQQWFDVDDEGKPDKDRVALEDTSRRISKVLRPDGSTGSPGEAPAQVLAWNITSSPSEQGYGMMVGRTLSISLPDIPPPRMEVVKPPSGSVGDNYGKVSNGRSEGDKYDGVKISPGGLALAYHGVERGGPGYVGAGKADKHNHGVNADGEPVGPEHIQAAALFFATEEMDAPLDFKLTGYPDAAIFSKPAEVWLTYDKNASHPYVGGDGKVKTAKGLWRWVTWVPWKPSIPGVPIPPPQQPLSMVIPDGQNSGNSPGGGSPGNKLFPPRDTADKENQQGAVIVRRIAPHLTEGEMHGLARIANQQNRPQQVAAVESDNELGAPAMSWRPMKTALAGGDLRYVDQNTIQQHEDRETAPIAARMEAFGGGASSDIADWAYNEQPGAGRYVAGTSASGGVAFLPAELGIEDVAGIEPPSDVAPSKPALSMVRSCLAWSWFVDADAGLPVDGYQMAQEDAGGNLQLDAVDPTGVLTPVRAVHPTGHYQHQSSTGHPTREVNNFGFLTSTSLTGGDHTLIVDTSLAAVPYDVNLPAVADFQNVVFQVSRFLASPGGASRRVRINPQPGEQINNLGAGVSLDLTSAGQSVTLKATGSQWHSF